MIQWQMESGDATADAAYVLMLPSLQERQRELIRLGLVHGNGHRWNVERAVRENWPAADSKLPPLQMNRHENPRGAALAAVGGKGGV